MKPAHLLPIALGVFSFGLLNVTLQACGGDTATVGDGGLDGTTGDDTGNPPPPDSGTPDDSGNTGNDGAGNDGAGNDGSSTMDGGGGASNPGKVTCGTMLECDSGASGCCVRIQMDGGLNYSCPAPMMCFNGVRWQCDEPADCPMQACCISTFQGVQKQCQNNCFMGQVRACKLNTDCGDGGTCNTYTCPGNVVINSCTKPNNCN